MVGMVSRLPMARRHQRASTAILLIIVFFSAFTLFTQSSNANNGDYHQPSYLRRRGLPFTRPSDYILRRSGVSPDGNASARREVRFTVKELPRSKPRAPVPPLRLAKAEELAAVIHFITAIPSNAITGVNPDQPIPPELLLGFNVRGGDRAKAELDNVVQNTWFEHPVVIFSQVCLNVSLRITGVATDWLEHRYILLEHAKSRTSSPRTNSFLSPSSSKSTNDVCLSPYSSSLYSTNFRPL